jgi:hypothetical protein
MFWKHLLPASFMGHAGKYIAYNLSNFVKAWEHFLCRAGVYGFMPARAGGIFGFYGPSGNIHYFVRLRFGFYAARSY